MEYYKFDIGIWEHATLNVKDKLDRTEGSRLRKKRVIRPKMSLKYILIPPLKTC